MENMKNMKNVKNMEKKQGFTEPEIKVVKLEAVDIITSSGDGLFKMTSVNTYDYMDMFN